MDGEVSQSTVFHELVGTVGHLCFDNPGKFNALPQMGWEAIPKVVDILIDGGARVLIVQGRHNNFCAGADISEFDTVRKNTETARLYEQTNSDAFQSIRDVPVPTIAKIEGYCLGGGFGLAAACDLRIATAEARFSVPAAKIGLAYPVDAMADIVRSIGQQNAKRMLFTGEQLSAEDMLRFGFLSEIVDAETIDQKVQDLAHQICALAPLSHEASKAAINAAFGENKDHAIERGANTFMSKDYAEGRLAFKEKRKPLFQGE